MKGVGMLVVSLRVFWGKCHHYYVAHNYVAVKVFFRVSSEEI